MRKKKLWHFFHFKKIATKSVATFSFRKKCHKKRGKNFNLKKVPQKK